MFYNCRLYDYAVGQHVTFYTKTINTQETNQKSENLTKAYHNENRTEKEENHCNNVSYNRTKQKIYNLARSNKWDWFITITFDRTKTDASDYDEVARKMTKFLNNLRSRKAPDLIYLIVPELHKDGKHYHFHGLLANCGTMNFADSGLTDAKGNKIYNMPDWSFGFTTATKINDTLRASHYITKYITKQATKHLKNKKRYFASRNIKAAEPQLSVMDEETFLQIYADRITYCKTVDIVDAGQRVKYYELKD